MSLQSRVQGYVADIQAWDFTTVLPPQPTFFHAPSTCLHPPAHPKATKPHQATARRAVDVTVPGVPPLLPAVFTFGACCDVMLALLMQLVQGSEKTSLWFVARAYMGQSSRLSQSSGTQQLQGRVFVRCCCTSRHLIAPTQLCQLQAEFAARGLHWGRLLRAGVLQLRHCTTTGMPVRISADEFIRA